MTYQKLSFGRRKLLTIAKYVVIILLSFSLTLTIPTTTNAQISLFNSSNDSQSQFIPWWELGKTRVCGKLLCSDISFPYFPYASITKKFDLAYSFTIAARANLKDDFQITSNELEIRANLIEQIVIAFALFFTGF